MDNCDISKNCGQMFFDYNKNVFIFTCPELVCQDESYADCSKLEKHFIDVHFDINLRSINQNSREDAPISSVANQTPAGILQNFAQSNEVACGNAELALKGSLCERRDLSGIYSGNAFQNQDQNIDVDELESQTETLSYTTTNDEKMSDILNLSFEKNEEIKNIIPIETNTNNPGNITKSDESKVINLETPFGRKFICRFCFKNFKLENQLIYHCVSQHTVLLKPYTCSFCSTTFNDFMSIEKHERQHIEKIPKKCDICKQNIKAKDLKSHMKKNHSGDSSLKCQFCLKQYYAAYRLKRHNCIKNPKPNCRTCQMTFQNWNDFNKHIRNIHIEPSERKEVYLKNRKVINIFMNKPDRAYAYKSLNNILNKRTSTIYSEGKMVKVQTKKEQSEKTLLYRQRKRKERLFYALGKIQRVNNFFGSANKEMSDENKSNIEEDMSENDEASIDDKKDISEEDEKRLKNISNMQEDIPEKYECYDETKKSIQENRNLKENANDGESKTKHQGNMNEQDVENEETKVNQNPFRRRSHDEMVGKEINMKNIKDKETYDDIKRSFRRKRRQQRKDKNIESTEPYNKHSRFNISFCCPKCKNIEPNFLTFSEHFFNVHQISPYRCQLTCGNLIFKNGEALDEHNVKIHGKDKNTGEKTDGMNFRCDTCFNTFGIIKFLKHKLYCNELITLKCNICNLKFSNFAEKKAHRYMHPKRRFTLTPSDLNPKAN